MLYYYFTELTMDIPHHVQAIIKNDNTALISEFCGNIYIRKFAQYLKMNCPETTFIDYGCSFYYDKHMNKNIIFTPIIEHLNFSSKQENGLIITIMVTKIEIYSDDIIIISLNTLIRDKIHSSFSCVFNKFDYEKIIDDVNNDDFLVYLRNLDTTKL